MASIRGKNTRPEIALRKALHAAGFRYRLHVSDMPGKPDLVLPKYRAVVFVHGCFWHHHEGCHYAAIPSTRQDFWLRKFEANKRRHEIVSGELVKTEWRVAVVWECGLKHEPEKTMSSLIEFLLDPSVPAAEIPCVPPRRVKRAPSS